MNDDSTRDAPRTWTRSTAAQAQPATWSVSQGEWTERPVGWIVRIQDGDGRAVAADPTASEALALARERGFGEGGQASPATAAELDALLEGRSTRFIDN